MSIITKPIAELLDYEFVIPKYQRGYRWDEDQITALLNDLKAFQKDAQKDDFYCLQPVVVVKKKAEHDRYIIVDGQQRLTTILLILKAFMGLNEKCYKLEMDKRKEQEIYVSDHKFAIEGDESYKKNIDNFYVKKAYESILTWKNASPENSTAALFLSTLLKPGHIKGYAAVIWYEIDENDALDAFRRLNYGKIPLTSAELVKALLLQTDCYRDEDREVQIAIAQRRAMEWDEMEYRLADPLFTSMVCREGEDLDVRMDIILDFVADELNSKLSKRLIRKKENGLRQDQYIYNVFDAWIKEEIDSGKCRKDVISAVWAKVQDTFNSLADWYENLELFHLIGLWRLMYNGRSRMFIKEVYRKMFIGDDIRKGQFRNKPEFIEALRKHIGSNFIKVPEAFEPNEETGTTQRLPDNQQGLNSPDLNYEGTQQKRLINILTAFNVMIVQNDPSGARRFPFHLFQRYKTTSLEHIHPQNITENIKFNDAVKWVRDRKEDASKADDSVWAQVAKSFGWKTPENADEKEIRESLDKAIDEAKNKVNESINALNFLLENDDTFKNEHTLALEHLRVLDTLFGDMAGIKGEELHAISNMALVSKGLNSALGNNYLDVKRSITIEYDSLPKDDEKATFVPPATHMVFSKSFRAKNPGNMKFWQPEDRKAYLTEIQKVYDYFVR